MNSQPSINEQFLNLISQMSSANNNSSVNLNNKNNNDSNLISSLFKKSDAQNLCKEKKKFSPEISDRLVVEVLKRKELLIDNNTSRDLQFSESKRIAWAEVKRILMQQYPSFDQEVEPIKSHWRYRKRKVTEALMDGLKCGSSDWEDRVLRKLSCSDRDIYYMLLDSGCLETLKVEMTMLKERKSLLNSDSLDNSEHVQQRPASCSNSCTSSSSSSTPPTTMPINEGSSTAIQQEQQQQNKTTTTNNGGLDKVTSALWSRIVAAQQHNLAAVKPENSSTITANGNHHQEASTSGLDDSTTTQPNSIDENSNSNEPNRNYLNVLLLRQFFSQFKPKLLPDNSSSIQQNFSSLFQENRPMVLRQDVPITTGSKRRHLKISNNVNNNNEDVEEEEEQSPCRKSMKLEEIDEKVVHCNTSTGSNNSDLISMITSTCQLVRTFIDDLNTNIVGPLKEHLPLYLDYIKKPAPINEKKTDENFNEQFVPNEEQNKENV